MTVRLWIRADASASIGLGHIMRDLALAERAERRQLSPRFVVGGTALGLCVVRDRGFLARRAPSRSEDWISTTAPGDLVIFDGYHFSSQDMQACRGRGCRVGAIDDLGSGHFPVDVLLNQNPVVKYGYSTPSTTVRLFGPAYALVREEFLRYRRDRATDPPRVLLMTMGGSDVGGLTEPMLKRLRHRSAFERVVAIVGPAARLGEGGAWPADIEIVRSPRDIASVFDSADAAIAASGSTTWELLALGMPTALVRVADNQAAIGPGVAQSGAALFLGSSDEYADSLLPAVEQLASPELRRRLCRNALATVDARGADRFLDSLMGDGCDGTAS